jgi:hypothetical protein
MAEQTRNTGIAVRPVSFIAAGIVAALALAVGLLAFSFHDRIGERQPAIAGFPEPSVRTDERAERLSLEKIQRNRLAGRNGGIPIGEAMQMIVARGAKAYDPVTGAAP